MTTLEQAALKLSLINRLKSYARELKNYDLGCDILGAIELLEQKQEPEAYNHGWFGTGAMAPGEARCIKCGEWKNAETPKREWVGLTDEEVKTITKKLYGDVYNIGVGSLKSAIEAKLKEKNT
jgi:hypothetical protein